MAEGLGAMRRAKNVLAAGIVIFIFGLVLAGPCLAVQSRVDALLNKADAYGKQGNMPMATKLYSQAIKMQPGNMGIYFRRAFMWGKAGYFGYAIKDFSLVMERGRGYSHASRFRADCYVALGMVHKGVNDYTEFLRREPNDGKVWSYLAEAYALSGQKDLALQAVYKGLATGSHWSKRLRTLQMQILSGEKITPHKPLSN